MSLDGRFDPKAVDVTTKSFFTLGLLSGLPEGKELYTDNLLP